MLGGGGDSGTVGVAARRNRFGRLPSEAATKQARPGARLSGWASSLCAGAFLGALVECWGAGRGPSCCLLQARVQAGAQLRAPAARSEVPPRPDPTRPCSAAWAPPSRCARTANEWRTTTLPALAAQARFFCNAMPWVDCTAVRYHCTRMPDVDLCPEAFAEGRFPPGCSAADFVRIDAADPKARASCGSTSPAHVGVAHAAPALGWLIPGGLCPAASRHVQAAVASARPHTARPCLGARGWVGM